MDMHLLRKDFREDGIYGEMTGKNAFFITLEHSFDLKPALADGEYICKRFLSPHLGYEVFQITDVPGHTFILIHIGNFNGNSDGCVLLGSQIGYTVKPGGWMITGSKQAFAAFMKLQEGVDEFKLTVESRSQSVA